MQEFFKFINYKTQGDPSNWSSNYDSVQQQQQNSGSKVFWGKQGQGQADKTLISNQVFGYLKVLPTQAAVATRTRVITECN